MSNFINDVYDAFNLVVFFAIMSFMGAICSVASGMLHDIVLLTVVFICVTIVLLVIQSINIVTKYWDELNEED